MRFAARLIATMAFALFAGSGLFADDIANPKANAKKDETVASSPTPAVTAKAQPDSAKRPLEKSSPNAQSQSGADAHLISH